MAPVEETSRMILAAKDVTPLGTGPCLLRGSRTMRGNVTIALRSVPPAWYSMLLDHDPARAFMPYPAVPVANAPSGPLAGLTFAAKDLFDVAGYPTGCGSPHMLAMSGIKTRTAPTVQKLLDSGARFVGKTITDELAFSMSGKNAHFGTP